VFPQDIFESTLKRTRRSGGAGWVFSRKSWKRTFAGAVALLAVVVGVQATSSAAGFQRGPDPTIDSISAPNGSFSAEEVKIDPGNGFGGGTIHYPGDTGQGSFGGVVICPAFAAGKGYYEWIGSRLASFGFVAFVIDTNSPNDYPDARKDQVLAAADYLSKDSPVRDRVDGGRIAVVGHSAGGGGVLLAAAEHPEIKAAVGLSPGLFGGDLSNLHVPTMITSGGAGDIGKDMLDGLYNSIPNGTPKAFVEITNGGHGYPAGGNGDMYRTLLLWLKVFVDEDSRYTQFLCPDLANRSGISDYRNTCPYL
jgi:dienelactone hydrolase